eukprot:84013-Pyramimonas_sp.AAC.1
MFSNRPTKRRGRPGSIVGNRSHTAGGKRRRDEKNKAKQVAELLVHTITALRGITCGASWRRDCRCVGIYWGHPPLTREGVAAGPRNAASLV